MNFIHPNLSEHYGSAFDLADLPHRINDAGDHIELAQALYDATALPPIELRRVMRALARREGAAALDVAHELVARRLRAYLKLDVEEARVAARAFADAHVDLPEGWSERSREIEFSVIKNALHLRECVTLTQVLPWLRDLDESGWLNDQLSKRDDSALATGAKEQPTVAAER